MISMVKKMMITVVEMTVLFTYGYETWTDPDTGVEWKYTINGDAVEIGTGCWGNQAVPEGIKGSLLIPSEILGRSVTRIGRGAFCYCKGLTFVSIPSTVTSIASDAFFQCFGLESVEIGPCVARIEGGAFYCCESLKAVVIPGSVVSIGDSVFSECSSLMSITVEESNPSYKSENGCLLSKDGRVLIAGVAGDVVIPTGVTKIGDSAFEGCGLTSVEIPSSVTNIEDDGFRHCVNLTTVTIPSSVISLGNYAFGSCSGLQSVTISSSIKQLGEGVFQCCGLTSVAIPLSVTNIGYSAFEECEYLTSVTIPPSVISIGDGAFDRCRDLVSVMIPSSVVSIGPWAFCNCESLKAITIPGSVASIGDSVFSGCGSLMLIAVEESNQNYKSENGCLLSKDGRNLIAGVAGDVVIPAGVTHIGDGAFEGGGLTSVEIPSSVTNIGWYALAWCTNLCTVSIPSSVMDIGEGVLVGCSALMSVIVEEANQNYKSEGGCLLSKDGTRLIAGVNGDVIIPAGVTDIGYRAFEGRSGLTSVAIPDSVDSIGGNTFYDCDSLEALYFDGPPPSDIVDAAIDCNVNIYYSTEHESEWLPIIKDCGFANAVAYVPYLDNSGPHEETRDSITWEFYVTNGEARISGVLCAEGDVNIPSAFGRYKVTSVADRVFRQSGIVSVTIPSGVTNIGNSAFSNCNSLKDVFFEGNECQFSIGESKEYNTFKNCHWDLIFHVPSGWKGRGSTMFGYSVVRDGSAQTEECVKLTVTNVVVHYVLNSFQPDLAVPAGGDTGFVSVITEVSSSGVVSVPHEWAANYPAFQTKYGSDFGKSLMMMSGKKDGAGNPMYVWQDFVAGTDPTDPDDNFTAFILIVDGKPVISYTPELTAEQKAIRVYKTYGKVKLQDPEWEVVPNGRESDYNFFKISVEMR